MGTQWGPKSPKRSPWGPGSPNGDPLGNSVCPFKIIIPTNPIKIPTIPLKDPIKIPTHCRDYGCRDFDSRYFETFCMTSAIIFIIASIMTRIVLCRDFKP